MPTLKCCNAMQMTGERIGPGLIHSPKIQIVKPAGKEKGRMAVTKDDMILEELRYLRNSMDAVRSEVAVLKHVSTSIEEMNRDLAVLKAKHDTGNMSEKVCASVAILALIVSSCVAATSCKEHNEKMSNSGRKPVSRTMLLNGKSK